MVFVPKHTFLFLCLDHIKRFFFYIISIIKLSPQVVSRWRDLDSILSIRRIWYRLLASLMVHWVFITKLNIWSGKHTCNRMIVTHNSNLHFFFVWCLHTHSPVFWNMKLSKEYDSVKVYGISYIGYLSPIQIEIFDYSK